MTVVEYYCFFIIVIVGPPYFLDTVCWLKETQFRNLTQMLHSFDGPHKRVVVILQVCFASIVVSCESITDFARTQAADIFSGMNNYFYKKEKWARDNISMSQL